jgi:hypothetical protein
MVDCQRKRARAPAQGVEAVHDALPLGCIILVRKICGRAQGVDNDQDQVDIELLLHLSGGSQHDGNQTLEAGIFLE